MVPPTNDLAPHGAVLNVKWSVEELRPDGLHAGSIAAEGLRAFEYRGRDLALCKARLAQIWALLGEEMRRDGIHREDTPAPTPAAGGGAQPHLAAMSGL